MKVKELDIIDDFLFKKKTEDIQLFIAKNNKKQPVLYVQDTYTGKKAYLKLFFGEFQYRKFLIEAVLLRLMADKASSKKARDCYYKLAKFLKDKSNEDFDI